MSNKERFGCQIMTLYKIEIYELPNGTDIKYLQGYDKWYQMRVGNMDIIKLLRNERRCL